MTLNVLPIWIEKKKLRYKTLKEVTIGDKGKYIGSLGLYDTAQCLCDQLTKGQTWTLQASLIQNSYLLLLTMHSLMMCTTKHIQPNSCTPLSPTLCRQASTHNVLKLDTGNLPAMNIELVPPHHAYLTLVSFDATNLQQIQEWTFL